MACKNPGCNGRTEYSISFFPFSLFYLRAAYVERPRLITAEVMHRTPAEGSRVYTRVRVIARPPLKIHSLFPNN